MNNKEFNDLIKKAIDTLINAKEDKTNRKKLIIESINCIDSAISKINNSEIIEPELPCYINRQSIDEQGNIQSNNNFSICTKFEKVSPSDNIKITCPSDISVPFMRIVEFDKDKNFVQLKWNILKDNKIVFTLTDKTEYVKVSFKYTNETYLERLYTEYTLLSMNYVENEVPYISTYYIKPIVKPNEEVIIDYYIRDYHGKDIFKDEFTDKFTVTVRIDGKDDIIIKNLQAGDHSVNLGSFPELDGEEQKFSMLCTDQYGRNSHELFNFFLVRNEPEVREYIMTEEDLVKYNIKNDDDYEIFKLVGIDLSSGTNSEERQSLIDNGLLEAFNNEVVPSNKYTVLAVDSTGKGVPDLNYHRHMIKYADDYDVEVVKTEATNTRVGLQQLLDDKQAEGYNKVKLLKGTYRISCTGSKETIYIPDRLTLDMNGATLKLNQFTGSSCMMVELNNTFDSHVINGIIEGDYFTHDYQNSPNSSEWACGINICGEAKYSSFEDIEIKNITGYGSTNGIANSRDGKLGYVYGGVGGYVNSFSYGDIDRNTGKDITGFDRTRTDFIPTKGIESIGYASISKYLGYQGIPFDTTWNLVVYFYDENKNFIKSTDVYQYRRFAVPSNARYVRVVSLKETYAKDLNLLLFRIPTHCSFKRIKHDNCRCVGMAPSAMNNMLFEDCEFTRSGQNSANCAFDAEDGWDMMQDVTFRRFNFYDNPNNEFLTCAGHNFILEDMINGKVYIWERTKDFVLRNSNCRNVSLGYNESIVRHGVYRVYNNTIESGSIGSNMVKNCTIKSTMRGIVKNCTMNGMPNDGDFTNCEINVASGFLGYLGNLKMTDCIIKPTEDFIDRYGLSFNDTSHNDTHIFNDCKFYGKSKLANHNCFSDGVFNNCYFEDTYIEANVQGNEDEVIQFNNCEINSTNDVLVRYCPHNYTVGNYTNIQFNNCDINSDTITTFAYGYSKPANGVLETNSCNVNISNLTLFFNCYPSYLENIKDFRINIINTNITCEKMLHDNLVKLGDVIKITKE